METEKGNVHIRRRNRLKWKIRNNYVFIIIIAIICTVLALLVGTGIYHFHRDKSMETILGRSRKSIHQTGISDQDVEALRKVFPDFHWEKTWDRKRWLSGQEGAKDRRSKEKARQ